MPAIVDTTTTSTTATTTTLVDNTQTFSVSGSVAGRVVGADGLPIQGITVAYNSPARVLATATTNAQGMYEITGLPSGAYEIFLGGGNHTIGRQNFNIDTLTDIVAATLGSLVYDETGNIPDGQFYVDRFGTYKVNYHLPDTTVYPLTASVKGNALLETVDSEYNRVTTIAPVGYTVGIQVSTMPMDSESDPVILDGIYTGKVGSGGAFLIEKLPAAFPTPLIYFFFIISSDNATSAVAYKINDEGWHIASEAKVASDFKGFATALRANETVDTGEITFVSEIKPVITKVSPDAPASAKFLPGTTATPTPLVFTFSKAMNQARGTITVVDDAATPASYVYSKAWDATNTILTVTPATPFEYGRIIKATLSGFEAADGVKMDGKTIDFYVRDALKQISTSWYSPWTNTDVQKVTIDASPTITFNYDLTGYTATTTTTSPTRLVEVVVATSDERPIEAIFTASGKTLTIDPSSSLKYNTNYKVYYEVTDGVTKLNNAAAAATFTTIAAPQLQAPTLSKHDLGKRTVSGTEKYNSGQTAIYVAVTKDSAVKTVTGFAFACKKNTDLGWISLDSESAIKTFETNSYWYYTVTIPTWASGETVQLIAMATGTGPRSEASNIVSFTDEIAPANVLWDGDPVAATGTLDLALPDNATTNYRAHSYTIGLPGAELMRLPTVSLGATAIANLTYEMVINTDRTQATLRILVAPGSAAAPVNPAGQIRISVADGANNEFDFDTVTPGINPLIINF